MSIPTEKIVNIWERGDWRITMGIVITAIWILLGLTYLIGSGISSRTVFDIPIENIGSFLEGAFAPLAFLWLVIGLFVQQRELSDNTEVLRRSLQHSEEQARAIAISAISARQDSFFKIADSVQRQLGGIAGLLFSSSMGQPEHTPYGRDDIRDMFQTLSLGDNEVFIREFLLLDPEPYGGYEHLWYGTEIRRRHSANYIRTYDRLLELADESNIDDIIVDSLTQIGIGIFYNRLKEYAPAETRGD